MAAALALQDIGSFIFLSYSLSSDFKIIFLALIIFLTILSCYLVSEADWVIVKAGIGGTKYALESLVQAGLGGVVRKPLPEASEAVKKMVDEGLVNAMAMENSL